MAVSEFGREGKRPGPGEVGGFQERLPCASSSLSYAVPSPAFPVIVEYAAGSI